MIVMYGASPTPWEPFPFPDRTVPTPTPGVLPLPASPAPLPGRGVVVGPTAPETAEVVRARIEERIAWLKNELRMHDAWRAELALLERMMAATESAPDEKGGA